MMMAKKKAKALRLTAKRKVFIDAIQRLRKYFEDNGTFKDEQFDVADVADSIAGLWNKAPKSVRGIDCWAALIGSALFIVTDMDGKESVDTCHEECRGGVAFHAAFLAGFWIGSEDGRACAEEVQAIRVKEDGAK